MSKIPSGLHKNAAGEYVDANSNPVDVYTLPVEVKKLLKLPPKKKTVNIPTKEDAEETE